MAPNNEMDGESITNLEVYVLGDWNGSLKNLMVVVFFKNSSICFALIL